MVIDTVVIILTACGNVTEIGILPIQCIYVNCVDLRTNSYYFPIQH